MDMADKDNLEPEKRRNEDLLNYHSSNMPQDWQLSTSNLANASMGVISSGNPMAACKGNMLESSSCSSATMVESFCPMWDQPTSSQNIGFSDINVQHNTSTSNALGNRPSGLVPLRPGGLDGIAGLGWAPANAMLKGSMFLPGTPGFIPQTLPHFPADSGFIERAARYSCFSGGNFGDIMNPFSIAESMNPYSRIQVSAQASQEAFITNGPNTSSGPQSQKNEMNMGQIAKPVCLPAEHGTSAGSPLKNEKNSESLARSHDEAKRGVGGSSNESDEAEFSGRGAQEELDGAGVEASSKGVGSKKRRRSNQDAEMDQNKGFSQPTSDAKKDHCSEIQHKEDQNPTSNTSKPSGKNAKQGTHASDSLKEEYIHVRARRGQATNSHSLAERVRREKISERMKFLQDLVPGCSKVTGKAVMLDEIINYVQSLQRQVEFLSMKLATVNPRLDFNLEGLLTKDILQPRAGPLSSLAFPPDMTLSYPPLHQSQGIVQTGSNSLGNSTDALRRCINLPLAAMSGGYKEANPHASSAWDDELNNIVQMGLNSSAPLSSQDLSGPLPPGHMKAEL
ncbi:hypothetical protein M9H77_09741 [Catharanthus roseus]|uniref:Uncharacterized protein n=1 Tax=Catharanthus roseus TaxID=4058 RepID=A0ACC0C1X8_CATRO|nr:hypothetical protein M9H77_09741 [Catharanthus roseus]